MESEFIIKEKHLKHIKTVSNIGTA